MSAKGKADLQIQPGYFDLVPGAVVHELHLVCWLRPNEDS
jgi:hypothetical protein